jgi:hemolysin III
MLLIRLKEERFSAYSHLAGIILSIIGTVLILEKANGNANYIGSLIVYGLSLVFLFSSSFLYHSRKKKEDEVSFWRRLDHIAIFVMIAGNYTPLCIIYLDEPWKWIILSIQWGLVIAGIIMKLFIMNAPRWITIGIYLAQGWMIIIPIGQLFQRMTPFMIFALFFGGILYSIGAIVYKMKKPNPKPGIFGFHEIFHVFIILAAFTQYMGLFVGIA